MKCVQKRIVGNGNIQIAPGIFLSIREASFRFVFSDLFRFKVFGFQWLNTNQIILWFHKLVLTFLQKCIHLSNCLTSLTENFYFWNKSKGCTIGSSHYTVKSHYWTNWKQSFDLCNKYIEWLLCTAMTINQQTKSPPKNKTPVTDIFAESLSPMQPELQSDLNQNKAQQGKELLWKMWLLSKAGKSH